MKRRARRRLATLSGATMLVILALWQWRHDDDNAPGPLTTLDPASVQHIGLQWPGQPMHDYEYRDGHWWLAGTPSQRSDDGRLQELAQTAAAPVLQWRSTQDFSLAKIGLAPPGSVLILNGERIEFGETSVTGPQRYVRVGDRIALIPARFSPRPIEGKSASLGLEQ